LKLAALGFFVPYFCMLKAIRVLKLNRRFAALVNANPVIPVRFHFYPKHRITGFYKSVTAGVKHTLFIYV
jgi:hypothetical protein